MGVRYLAVFRATVMMGMVMFVAMVVSVAMMMLMAMVVFMMVSVSVAMMMLMAMVVFVIMMMILGAATEKVVQLFLFAFRMF
jgi:hypothetical protein